MHGPPRTCNITLPATQSFRVATRVAVAVKPGPQPPHVAMYAQSLLRSATGPRPLLRRCKDQACGKYRSPNAQAISPLHAGPARAPAKNTVVRRPPLRPAHGAWQRVVPTEAPEAQVRATQRHRRAKETGAPRKPRCTKPSRGVQHALQKRGVRRRPLLRPCLADGGAILQCPCSSSARCVSSSSCGRTMSPHDPVLLPLLSPPPLPGEAEGDCPGGRPRHLTLPRRALHRSHRLEGGTGPPIVGRGGAGAHPTRVLARSPMLPNMASKASICWWVGGWGVPGWAGSRI